MINIVIILKALTENAGLALTMLKIQLVLEARRLAS